MENPCIHRLKRRHSTKVLSMVAKMPMFSISPSHPNCQHQHANGGKSYMENRSILLCAHSQPMGSIFRHVPVRQLVFHPSRRIPLPPLLLPLQQDPIMYRRCLMTRKGPLLAVDRLFHHRHSLRVLFPRCLLRNAYRFLHFASQHHRVLGEGCHLLRHPTNLRHPSSLGYIGRVHRRSSATAPNLRHHL